MEERGWASRGSRDTKGRWGGRETRGRTGRGQAGRGWGGEGRGPTWQGSGSAWAMWEWPLLTPHPAQLHFPSHSSPITQPHCQHSPQDQDPSPSPLQPPQPPVHCKPGRGKPDFEGQGGKVFHSHALTKLHPSFQGFALCFEQRRSPCTLLVPGCKSGMLQPAPMGAWLPSSSSPSPHTWGMLPCPPSPGRGAPHAAAQPDLRQRRRRRTACAAASHPASTGKSAARRPAGRSREMSGSRALPHLGAGKTPPLPKPELVSPPRLVSRGEKHLVAGGRRDPFGLNPFPKARGRWTARKMRWQHGCWLGVSKPQRVVQRSPFFYPKISSSPAIPGGRGR